MNETEELLEDIVGTPPQVLVFIRKHVSVLPGGQKIGVYYNDQLKKNITIPFTDGSMLFKVHEGEEYSTQEQDMIDPNEKKPKNPPKGYRNDVIKAAMEAIENHSDIGVRLADSTTVNVDQTTAQLILNVWEQLAGKAKFTFRDNLNAGAVQYYQMVKFVIQHQ